MSLPENPLSRFRSHSYHHILMICDNVETAVSVSNDVNIDKFTSPNIDNVRDVSLLVDSKTSGKYVILTNGLNNGRYAIETLKWESITGQLGDNGADNYTSMATEGLVNIVEPKGMKFLNEIQETYKLLNSDPSSCVWMIKTLFVGYNDSNSSNYISNVRPLIFTVVDLVADFTIAGSSYDISFVNINNGSGKMPQLIKAAETIKINLGENTTLSNAIENLLASKINENSKRHFNEVKSAVESNGLTPKEVTYKFILDEEYKNSRYLIDDSQQQNKTNGTAESGCHLDFTKSITVENAIKKIMKHCSQVKIDAKGVENGPKYGYKIRSILNSDKTKHEIIYVITRYRIVFSNIFKDINSSDDKVKNAIADNTIVFDYIYSGKNTDILDFSMKMDLGLVFFQTIISSNNIASQKDLKTSNLGNTNQTSQNIPENTKESLAPKPILPIFFSTTMKNLENTNSKNPKASTEFQTLMNRHLAIENLDTKMKITGNPSLLNSINKIPETFNTIEEISSASKPSLPHWETVPALAKVNIFMPSSDSNGIPTKEKFWYDGFYLILGVANSFDSGNFTQTLEMISVPTADNIGADNSYSKDKTEENNSKTPNKDIPEPGINLTKTQYILKIENISKSIGNAENVDYHLIMAIIKQSSAFNPNLISSNGKYGLMQILPNSTEDITNLLIAEKNISAGTKLLKTLLTLYSGDLNLTLAAFLDGQDTVTAHNGIPPFKSTNEFIIRVRNNYNANTSGVAKEQKDIEILKTLNTKPTIQSIPTNIKKESIANVLGIHNSKSIL